MWDDPSDFTQSPQEARVGLATIGRALGTTVGVWSLGFRVSGQNTDMISGAAVTSWGLGFGVWGLGSRVKTQRRDIRGRGHNTETGYQGQSAYRGTSLIRKHNTPGPYRSNMPRDLW